MIILKQLHMISSKKNCNLVRFVKNVKKSPISGGKSGFFVNTLDSLAY